MGITFESIKKDLVSLGVKPGDTVFLRISYKAIGKLEGGPRIFIDAIMELLGEEGTIILTAFPTSSINKLRLFHRKDAADAKKHLKSETGAMSNVAMVYPGAFISKRVDFPFVAIGKNAKYLTENHTYERPGYWILEEAIEKFQCKCLRIGGESFIGTTHMSLSHSLHIKGEYQIAPRYGLYVKDDQGLTWRENENVIFCASALKNYLPSIIDRIKLSEGKVGDGYAIITDMKKSLEAEEELLKEDLRQILCDNPDCWICRSSFSFSDTPRFVFFTRKFFSILLSNSSGKKGLIRALIENFIFATKNQ